MFLKTKIIFANKNSVSCTPPPKKNKAYFIQWSKEIQTILSFLFALPSSLGLGDVVVRNACEAF